MPFLDWVNKNQAKETTREVPYHLLKLESIHGDVSAANADNLLIQGENLLALKALIPFYAGRVKCIFIDPPYNTQSAFEHYDDKLEHSQWLSMMYPRLVLLRELLAEDGSIWVTIDDNEAHYLKVLMDEIFGRKNFLADVSWQKRVSPDPDSKFISPTADNLLVYAKSVERCQSNRLIRTAEMDARYENPDNDPRGVWTSSDLTRREYRERDYYAITLPSGRQVFPANGRSWSIPPDSFEELRSENRLWFGATGDAMPRRKRFLTEVRDGIVPTTWWSGEDAGRNEEGKREVKKLFPTELDVFATPKPERLMGRILHIGSNSGDLVLDSFLGSGTSAAVAHKMGRRFIGIEMGNHARTHCLPRLQKVIEGEQGGISASVEWSGGGGFRFCTLGEPAFDTDGRINSEVKFATLAAYVWHYETGEPGQQTFDKPLLGIHNGTAYYLLYNGILGDRRPAGGNVMTHAVLQAINEIFPHSGPKVVYGEMSRLGASRLAAEGITFKQTPYDVKMR